MQKKGTKSGEHLIKRHGEYYVQLYQSQCNLQTKENHVYKCWEGVFLTNIFYKQKIILQHQKNVDETLAMMIHLKALDIEQTLIECYV